MVAIQGYNQRIVRQAQVADTVNPQAIAEKAAGFNAVAQVAGAGADISARIEEADDVATINEMIITREREKIDFIEQTKKQYEGAPAGFSTYIEKEMKKRDAKAVAALPSRLQTAYKTTTAKSNLSDYEQNLGWETQRKVAVVGDKIGRAGKEISNISYTLGAQGKSFDEIVPQIDATMVAGSGVLAPEKLGKFDDDLRADAAKQYLAGVIARDPKEAQDLLNSGKFAKYLTTEDSLKMSKTIWDSTPDLMKLEQIKNSRQPLSVRNNNAGNIRGADGQFKKFATPEEGMKAMADDLRVKVTGKSSAMKAKFGEDYEPTLSNLIHTWAPTNENDTAAYIATVEKETGLKADQVLSVSDIPKLQAAMVKVEGGQSAANYFATGTAFDSLSYGEKINEAERIQKAITEDPAKAAMQYGADTPERIVQVQTDLGYSPQDAKVLTNVQASEMALKINGAKSTDEILAAAAELGQAYGPYKDNAIADLVATGKMKPAMNAALSLASLERPEYREHIDILSKIAQSDEAAIKANYSSMGYDIKSLESEIPDSYREMETALMNEGVDANYLLEQRKIMTNLAAVKHMQDGSTYSEAMDFAATPIMEQYGVAIVNNVPLRVPAAYDVGVVETAVEDFISDKIPSLISPESSEDYVYEKDLIIPVLNETRDGVKFITGGVGTLADAEGKAISVSFKELLAGVKPKKNKQPLKTTLDRKGIDTFLLIGSGEGF